MYVISNEPDICNYVSNTIGIPYPPVPSLAQAADIPPSSKRTSTNSGTYKPSYPLDQTKITPLMQNGIIQHSEPLTMVMMKTLQLDHT